MSASTLTYTVSGMTCEHCVASVKEELDEVAGVTATHVDLIPGGASTVTISTDGSVTDEAARAAITEAGYVAS